MMRILLALKRVWWWTGMIPHCRECGAPRTGCGAYGYIGAPLCEHEHSESAAGKAMQQSTPTPETRGNG